MAGHTWKSTQHARFKRTMARKRYYKTLARNGKPEPETIYILLNGRLQPFVLRNMPVYVPAEELTP